MKFAYTTLQSVRDFGISQLQMDDDLVLKLIPVYSDRINEICRQIFTPVQKVITFALNRGNQLVQIPTGKNTIIKINSIALKSSDGSAQPFDASEYELVDDYWVNFLTNKPGSGIFTSPLVTDMDLFSDIYIGGAPNVKNCQIDCVIGNVTNAKEVAVELASDISSGSTSFQVTDASDLEQRDILTFGNYQFIINSINYVTNTIEIDKQGNIPTIESGTTTTCYGQVPFLIEQVMNLFIKHHNTLSKLSGGNFTREQIGKYGYMKSGNTMGVTGINEIDSILYTFIKDGLDMMYL